MISLLLVRERTAGAIAEEFDISRSAVSEHFGILRHAGLVHETKSGWSRSRPIGKRDVRGLRNSSRTIRNDPGKHHDRPAYQYISRQVWERISTPDGIARWWGPGDIAPMLGHEFTMDMGKWGKVPCRVIEVVPFEKFAYTFDDWELHWTI